MSGAAKKTTSRRQSSPQTGAGGSAKARKVGDLVEAQHVVRPDGGEHDVSDGGYVLDVPGTFVVDGQEVTVK